MTERNLPNLDLINPTLKPKPEGFDRHEAMERAQELCARVRQEFPDCEVFWDGEVQDATYHAGICITPHGEIRLSNFRRLATITGEERIPPDVLSRMVTLIEESGYTWIPFRLFGEPFDTRPHFPGEGRLYGDTFTQLFDYF